VTELSDNTGATVRTYAVGPQPDAVAFDGTSIWVSNGNDNTVDKLLPATGAIVATYPVGARPTGVASDGSNIWVANLEGTVTEIRATK
jgi:hypothetical protein